MHGHIHVHGIVWSLGIILSTLIYDDLVKSLIKRMQLFYVIKDELKNYQHLLVDVVVHTTYISNSLNCNHTAPFVCSEYMDI